MAEIDDDKPVKTGKAPKYEDDGVRDFADYESAAACADALGGNVEPIGTAYHVIVPE